MTSARLPIFQGFLKYGADAELDNLATHTTAFMDAIDIGNWEVANFLLHGAYIEVKDIKGYTALAGTSLEFENGMSLKELASHNAGIVSLLDKHHIFDGPFLDATPIPAIQHRFGQIPTLPTDQPDKFFVFHFSGNYCRYLLGE
ncbi:hypothetical protein BJ875DRAFT_483122 [Amylocarpus encephaloides]|uniref:Uncharacterized protein n=1 Tax=Amylocarpus encephaloides TaxID=45428 RepID=A0A9P7YL20_9HELO|nr:hypothetical protein BJ875DRAFT_483122 [Amylocarpus encephaloides]